VLHSFKYGDDGARPITGLTLFNGMLYGTTRYGGTRDCRGRKGCGTVFMTDPQSGATAVVYRFTGGTDGAHPYAALTVQGGILYGTTLQGGSTTCGSGYGCGTAFALDPTTGKETVLHSFTGHDDGTFPDAPVTAFNGTLYGTTFSGGGGGCNLDGGCGTIYTLNPSTGAEAVLFALHQKTGFFPFLSLTLHGKTIYGAAADGGTGCLYCGTVFAFKP
jgi:uncharacterized repeat protein (TIGR03803 family)